MDELKRIINSYITGRLSLPGTEIERQLTAQSVIAFVEHHGRRTFEGPLVVKHSVTHQEVGCRVFTEENDVLVDSYTRGERASVKHYSVERQKILQIKLDLLRDVCQRDMVNLEDFRKRRELEFTLSQIEEGRKYQDGSVDVTQPHKMKRNMEVWKSERHSLYVGKEVLPISKYGYYEKEGDSVWVVDPWMRSEINLSFKLDKVEYLGLR